MLDLSAKEHLIRLLAVTAEVIGDEIKPGAAVLMAEDLATYPLPVLERALAACRRELKGRLSLAAILERIEDGHPSPNEAWAMAIPAADERNTVVWTGEMEKAWAVALPLIDAGDKIAARQAFLEAYTKLLKDARAERRPASYRPSLGFDAAGREVALKQAVERGLLGHAAVAPHMRITGPAPFNPVALLEGKVEPSPEASADMRKKLSELAEELAGAARRRALEDDEAAERQRAELEALKARELAKLREDER